MSARTKFKIGILAGGGGTTFEAVHNATQTGDLADTNIACVISNNGLNNPDAEIWEKATRLGVDIHHVSNKTQVDCTLPIIKGKPATGTISYEASARIAELTDLYGLDMLVALGFMRRVIGKALKEIPIANIHHGPLPETAGKHGIHIDEEVMIQGLDYSGPTLHWMDKRFDGDGLPMYDLDQNNLSLIIGHEPVKVTSAMRQEWQDHGTAKLLQAEDMRVEKLHVPGWIHLALEQL